MQELPLTPAMHLRARHCPVFKGHLLLQGVHLAARKQLQGENERGIWAAFVRSSCLRPYQPRAGAVKELNPRCLEHSCAQLPRSPRAAGNPPELPGFLAPRTVIHRLMEVAPCCTKLACETCVGSRTLNQGQTSAPPCLTLQHVRCIGRLAVGAAGQVRCLQMALAEPQIFPMELYPMPNGQQRSAERGSDAGRPLLPPRKAPRRRLPAPARSAGHSSQTLCWLTLQAPAFARENRSAQDFWGPSPFCQHKKFTGVPGGPEQRTLCASVESAKQSVCLLFSSSFH